MHTKQIRYDKNNYLHTVSNLNTVYYEIIK